MDKAKQSFIPNYIIKTSKVLSVAAPFLARKFAIKLFATPIKFRVPSSEQFFINGSKQQPLFFEDQPGFIQSYTYGNGPKKVLLMHGWSGRGSQMAHFSKKQEDQYTFYTFDAPGHGRSNGKDTNLKRFIESIELMDKHFGPFDFGIGHSLGSMALLNAHARGTHFDKLVLIGSGNKISDIALDFVDKIKLPPAYGYALKAHLDKRFGEDVDAYSSDKVAKKASAKVLLAHDENDLEVPVSSSLEIRPNLKQSELLITKGLGHTRILRNPKVIGQIHNFLNNED
ncbi:MAG: alpha/beta fold hydrolase [Flavobacteriaceae bacterium]